MRGQVSWVRAGLLDQSVREPLEVAPDQEEAAFGSGDVRIVSGSLGTEVKWKVHTPCIASMLRAVHHLQNARPPFILRFHAFGWFEEIYKDSWSAVRRIEEILARGDRHFISRAFVKDADPQDTEVPAVIRESLSIRQPIDEYAVECTAEGNSDGFVVDRIGPKSIIGRFWGTATSSYPCQSHNRFGDVVSEAYERVLQDGQPRYDQVIAALRFPDNQVRWLPYHRAIFTNNRSSKVASVTVVAVVARVDMNVL